MPSSSSLHALSVSMMRFNPMSLSELWPALHLKPRHTSAITSITRKIFVLAQNYRSKRLVSELNGYTLSDSSMPPNIFSQDSIPSGIRVFLQVSPRHFLHSILKQGWVVNVFSQSRVRAAMGRCGLITETIRFYFVMVNETYERISKNGSLAITIYLEGIRKLRWFGSGLEQHLKLRPNGSFYPSTQYRNWQYAQVSGRHFGAWKLRAIYVADSLDFSTNWCSAWFSLITRTHLRY